MSTYGIVFRPHDGLTPVLKDANGNIEVGINISGGTGSCSIAIPQDDATASAAFAISIGCNSVASSAGNVCIGAGAVASGTESIAIGGVDTGAAGDGAEAIGAESLAIGTESRAGGNSSIAIGAFSTTTSSGAVIVGNQSSSTAVNTVTVGLNSNSTNTNAIVVGTNSTASGVDAQAHGFNNSATSTNSLVWGRNSTASAQNAIAIGDAVTNAILDSFIIRGTAANYCRGDTSSLYCASRGLVYPLIETTQGAGDANFPLGAIAAGGILQATVDAGGDTYTFAAGSAATILANFPQVALNDKLSFVIHNNGAGGTLTLASGGGVTVTGTTVAVNQVATYVYQFTNIGAGTEAGTLTQKYKHTAV